MITDEGRNNSLHWTYRLLGICQCSAAAKSLTEKELYHAKDYLYSQWKKIRNGYIIRMIRKIIFMLL